MSDVYAKCVCGENFSSPNHEHGRIVVRCKKCRYLLKITVETFDEDGGVVGLMRLDRSSMLALVSAITAIRLID